MTGAGGRGATTLFVGAPTRLGHALNDFVRMHGEDLRREGVEALPNRVVTRALRAAIGGTDEGAALDQVLTVPGEADLFLSAIHALGRPSTAFRKRELFPEAERMIAGASRVLDGRVSRVVLAVEPLHFLFMSVARDELHERVRGAGWDVLYDISWADLVVEVVAAFPAAEIVVLTPHGIADGAGPVLHFLFGPPGFGLAAEAAGEAFFSAATVLYDPFDIEAKIGLDAVTCDLLEQRFKEDVTAMAKMPGVRVM